LNRPTGIAVSPDGYLFVADTFNDAVKYFSITHETVLLEVWHLPRMEPADYEEPTTEPGSTEILSDRFDELWNDGAAPDEEETPPE
jgi:DNA-binding beta-propeller fold protein YncE